MNPNRINCGSICLSHLWGDEQERITSATLLTHCWVWQQECPDNFGKDSTQIPLSNPKIPNNFRKCNNFATERPNNFGKHSARIPLSNPKRSNNFGTECPDNFGKPAWILPSNSA